MKQFYAHNMIWANILTEQNVVHRQCWNKPNIYLMQLSSTVFIHSKTIWRAILEVFGRHFRRRWRVKFTQGNISLWCSTKFIYNLNNDNNNILKVRDVLPYVRVVSLKTCIDYIIYMFVKNFLSIMKRNATLKLFVFTIVRFMEHEWTEHTWFNYDRH